MVTSLFCKLLFCLIFIYLFKKKKKGRAGRDGKQSTSLVYYSQDDKSLMEFLISKTYLNTKLKN